MQLLAGSAAVQPCSHLAKGWEQTLLIMHQAAETIGAGAHGSGAGGCSWDECSLLWDSAQKPGLDQGPLRLSTHVIGGGSCLSQFAM